MRLGVFCDIVSLGVFYDIVRLGVLCDIVRLGVFYDIVRLGVLCDIVDTHYSSGSLPRLSSSNIEKACLMVSSGSVPGSKETNTLISQVVFIKNNKENKFNIVINNIYYLI